jgi:hypothetical protein
MKARETSVPYHMFYINKLFQVRQFPNKNTFNKQHSMLNSMISGGFDLSSSTLPLQGSVSFGKLLSFSKYQSPHP